MVSFDAWPQLELVAFYESEFDEAAVSRIRSLVESLANEVWSLGPPEFVDSIDEDDLRTVGCGLWLLAARNDVGEPLDPSVDRRLLEEVTFLLEALRLLSEDLDADIEVQFGGESVGWIESGALDRGLSVGLLGEWRRILDQASSR